MGNKLIYRHSFDSSNQTWLSKSRTIMYVYYTNLFLHYIFSFCVTSMFIKKYILFIILKFDRLLHVIVTFAFKYIILHVYLPHIDI